MQAEGTALQQQVAQQAVLGSAIEQQLAVALRELEDVWDRSQSEREAQNGALTVLRGQKDYGRILDDGDKRASLLRLMLISELQGDLRLLVVTKINVGNPHLDMKIKVVDRITSRKAGLGTAAGDWLGGGALRLPGAYRQHTMVVILEVDKPGVGNNFSEKN